jgi:hypothetical protein
MKVRKKNNSIHYTLEYNTTIQNLQLQFFILAALVAVAAANSYKAAEYAPKYETKYEEVTYVSL